MRQAGAHKATFSCRCLPAAPMNGLAIQLSSLFSAAKTICLLVYAKPSTIQVNVKSAELRKKQTHKFSRGRNMKSTGVSIIRDHKMDLTH